MKQSLIWRGIMILGIVALAAYSGYPPGEKVKLGLDLRGGVHLVGQVKTEDAIGAETDIDIERLVRELEDEGVTGATVDSVDDLTFVLQGTTSDQDATVRDVAERFLPGWNRSGSAGAIRFQRRSDEINQIRQQAVEQAVQTIRNRIDELGVAEPVIQRQGNENRIVVQLPGVDDPERVKDIIKSTSFLEFRLVADPAGLQGGGIASSPQELLANFGGALPDGVEMKSEEARDDAGNLLSETFYALEERSVITGRDLRDARPSLGQFNEPVVSFSLNPEGAELFGDATGRNIGRQLAIVLDDKVQSAPRINGRITDSGVIEGQFTQQEVQDLSLVLRSGALPAEIEFLEERTVGPTLGQESIEKGVRAGLLAGGLVVLAMLLVYRGSGINAVVALALNVVLVFGMLAALGATLTLPGIAGIILTVGMAVDANVLVFERIREELNAGRTVKTAVQSGFEKALSSVLDANITTLIAAMFLFNFGTGPIRGFAVTLSIGILASVFTAIINSRWLFDLVLSRSGRVEKLSI